MKNLNQYPTPITDEFCKDLSNSNRTDWGRWQLTASKCAELERKLAACREALEKFVDTCDNFPPLDLIAGISDSCKQARETLAATTP